MNLWERLLCRKFFLVSDCWFDLDGRGKVPVVVMPPPTSESLIMHQFGRHVFHTPAFCLGILCVALIAPVRAAEVDDGKLHIIVFGAHPDDAELKAGGTAIEWAKQGHHVKLVSVTNGDIGHWRIKGEELAKRRLAE